VDHLGLEDLMELLDQMVLLGQKALRELPDIKGHQD
jgi:predicted solute-binding protein